MGAAVAEQELVTIGCRFSHTGGASHSTGAADVFDDDLLMENLAQARRQDASIGVDGPSGRERHQHGDRPRRVGLRPRDARDRRQRSRARGQMQKTSARKFHDVSSKETLNAKRCRGLQLMNSNLRMLASRWH